MVPENKITERQKELFEHITITHFLCFIVLFISLILGNKIFVNAITHPLINLLFFAVVTLIGSYLIFLQRVMEDSHSTEPKISTIQIVFAYVVLLFIITGLTVIVTGNSLNSVEYLLLLPILIAASMMGKKTGILVSCFCVILVLFFKHKTADYMSLVQLFESNLILISTMFIMGWFVGGVTNLENRHREQLRAYISSFHSEIMQRKAVEEQLSMLSQAVEQSPVLIMITDANGNINYINQKYTSTTEYLPEEVYGKNIWARRDQSKECTAIYQTVKSGKAWQGEIKNRKKNGEFYWERVTIAPFSNKKGEITHLIRVSEDITECKRIEKEMARIAQLNLVGEMAAGIAHEIRNPMTSVRGFLQLLGDKEECSRYKNYFDMMISELDRANSIITEFLTLARNKAMLLKKQNLVTIIRTLLPLLQKEGIKTDKYIQADLEEVPDLLLDEDEIRQLIINLVRNGLEAMPPGGKVIIRTYTEDNEVVFSVQDEGKGISAEVLEKIGTPFFTTKDKGTGLGLAVCYSIATRHKATISVDTSPGGSTFYVRFKIDSNSDNNELNYTPEP
ncbi:MAG TPA: ATP-binding protein [Bacillota bacterium]|nr:ATP-binding protein [Bacillota bacterium]HQD77007.1 ATP-binding protein [Bacillota bacterium]